MQTCNGHQTGPCITHHIYRTDGRSNPRKQTQKTNPMCEIHWRCFLIWAHSLEDFHAFLADLNKQRDRIRFTAEISTHSCNFLDITIHKSPSFQQTGIFSTKMYYKPTNTFSFPLGSKYMPTHIHKGIAIGEMTRVIQNITSPSLCNLYKRIIIKHFRDRGYPKHILKMLVSMKYCDRKRMLLPRRKKPSIERGISLCLEYIECQPTLRHILR